MLIFSFFFIFFHFLCLFFFSFLSFFHFSFLSFSFISFHFVSFSLLGAQNLIFLGINFVTISTDNSHVKNQFLGPSRGTPLGPLFIFSLLFFSRFFVFFLAFFSQFFAHFFIFLIFKCFSFSLFIFSEEKSFFFSFFLYFFQIFFLLALVSEFNCFLRSRCSMEMWRLDDTGRDWDWVGPPAWGRACFNSPEWGGGSSPVKTEPPQIVLLLWLF